MTPDPLLNPSALQQFLRDHALPPLDRFGQHFLVDADVLQEIVDAAAPDPDVPIVEIGAGMGALTRAVAGSRQQAVGSRRRTTAPIIAVELDRRLIPLLIERIREFPFVHVTHADILKTSPSSLLPGSQFQVPSAQFDVVGNIPYNITAKLLRHVLAWTPRPRRLTFLLDASVAERIAAQPPNMEPQRPRHGRPPKHHRGEHPAPGDHVPRVRASGPRGAWMSVLAIAVQVFATPHLVGDPIPPSAFVPLPAVSSRIVRLDVHTHPLVSSTDERAFFRLVRGGFSQKRKTLQNALRALWRCTPAEAAQRLTRAGIEPTRRAETLSIDEWKRLLSASSSWSASL